VESLPLLKALVDDLRGAIEPSPLVAIDEEGGRVTRLAPHVEGLPSASSMAALGPKPIAAYWERYGRLLSRLGADVAFPPVVDLCPPDAPTGIADRSYGTAPAAVVACAGAAIDGLEAAGILPTIKHFPGLGDTLLDSHH